MKMLIGGKKVDSSDGRTIDVINPATLEVLGTVPSADWEDLDLILDNAQNGLREWSKIPLFTRIEILKKFK